MHKSIKIAIRNSSFHYSGNLKIDRKPESPKSSVTLAIRLGEVVSPGKRNDEAIVFLRDLASQKLSEGFYAVFNYLASVYKPLPVCEVDVFDQAGAH